MKFLKKQFYKTTAVLLSIIIMLAGNSILSVFALELNETETKTKITILHTNDTHGRTEAEPYISQMASELKSNGENVLIFDSGDRLHGQVTANLSEGESMISVMNAVGYNGMVPGNHDFSFGFERLKELSELARFPMLAANIKDSNGTNVFEQYKIFDFDGVKVGVFGIATPETLTKTDARNVAGLNFEEPAKTGAAMVAALQAERCDIIIALTHLGEDLSSDFSNRSDALAAVPGIDLILDGHSHTLLESGRVVENTLIAQVGNYGQNIGVVELVISSGKVSKSAKIIELSELSELSENSRLFGDPKIIEVIEAEEAKIEAERAEIETTTSVVVGYTPVRLEGEREFVRKGETNLANVVTDSLIHATGADIAIYNGGGIRESIEPGDITMGQVLTVLPFSNSVITLELSGADILKALEHGVSGYPELTGAYIQVAGLEFSFNPDANPGERVVEVKLSNGKVLEEEQIYTVSTIEYLVLGGDGYVMLESGENLIYYGDDAEAFANYLKTAPDIKAEAEGRVSVFSGNLETGEISGSENPNTGVSGYAVLWFSVSLVVSRLSVKRKNKLN